MATVTLFFRNLRYRYQEWKTRPRVYFVSLRQVKRDDAKRDW